MSILLDVLLLVGSSVVLACGGLLFVRRKFVGNEADFFEHHEIAGYILSVIGTLYSILLGLIVVNVQTKFDEARTKAQIEASCCSDIYNFCRGIPVADRERIRSAVREYYVVVQEQDWEAISSGRAVEGSIPAYQSLWREVSAYEPAGNRESACYSAILDSLRELSDARRYRMLARKRGLSPIVWMVLVIGAVMVIVFTFFFWVKNPRVQALLTLFVAVFVSLNLLLVKLFGDPYRAELQIKTGAFSLNRKVFGSNDDSLEKSRGVDGAAPPTTSPDSALREAQPGSTEAGSSGSRRDPVIR